MLALCTVITSLLIKKQSPVTASVIGLSLCLIISINIMPSRNRDNAFDLSIGISSYLFRYPTLFNHKEEFTAKQKRTQQRLIQVNQNNIQEIVKKLS